MSSFSGPTTYPVRPLIRRFDRMPHPVRLFPLFRELPYPLLLDSSDSAHGLGRYSYLAADPFLVLTAWEDRCFLTSVRGRVETAADPFTLLREHLDCFQTVPAEDASRLPPFQAGAAGYLGYDLGRLLERLPSIAADDAPVPLMTLPFYDWVLAYDAAAEQGFLFSTGFPDGNEDRAAERASWVTARVERLSTGSVEATPFEASPIQSNFTRPAYLRAAKRVKEYLAAGDVYQVNLSQRLETTLSGDPWDLYLRLREINPSPFGAYFEFPGVTVLSASPEQFLSVSGRQVTTKPIKGTRARGSTSAEDEELAAELAASEKDRAENVMIVDLLRNDLGRVCEIGSVQVPELFALEAHPTVWHLVSSITGGLAEGRDRVDLLQASFPGGSITGAPKIRAMEIIEELEPTRRGIYCGSIGYFGFDGAMNTSIAIRTMTAVGARLLLQAGGGIVADSDPEAEYQETMDKARGLLRALGFDG